MKLSRHTLMASLLLASGLVFSLFGSAHAQRATYRTVSGHGYGHGCPCPTDCEDGAESTDQSVEQGEEMVDEMGEDLPEVADLTGDAAVASAAQSAAPFAIGDSLAPSLYFSTILGTGTVSPWGSPYKATHNNSAVPQSRVFFNYNYFHDGAYLTQGGATQQVNPQFYELGAEYAFWCNMASVQVIVPMNYGFENNPGLVAPFATGTEFGNVQVALKTVLCQDECTTWTAGVGADLPTADDFTFGTTTVENDVVTLAPYLAHLRSIGCDAYAQAFAQVSIPLSETDIAVGATNVDLDNPAVLYLDLSVGKWLNQDCCGNGLLAIAELHYTDALSSDAVAVGGDAFRVDDYEMLNATFGVSAYRNCWVVTPAVVLPILEDAVWDYEFAVQVNRRF